MIVCGALAMSSQEKEKKNALVTIRGNIGIPKSISSQMFRTSFNGVYETNLSVCARLFSNFHAGLGYQNSHFQNNKKIFVFYSVPPGQQTSGHSLSYNTRLLCHAGFVRLGYDKFFSEKGYMSFALNTGVLYGKYLNVIRDSSAFNMPFVSTDFTTQYLQPEISINFIAEKLLSFSVMISNTYLFHHFDPKAPRFNHFREINTTRNRSNISWLNLGFGFNILLNDK
jgi:hypothetical protein